LYLSWAHILAVLLKIHPQKKQKKNRRMINEWLRNDREKEREKWQKSASIEEIKDKKCFKEL